MFWFDTYSIRKNEWLKIILTLVLWFFLGLKNDFHINYKLALHKHYKNCKMAFHNILVKNNNIKSIIPMTTTFVGFTIFTFDFVDYIIVLYSKWKPVVESFDKKKLKAKYSPITSSIYVEQIAISRWLQLQNNSDLKVHKQREN